MNEEFLNLKRFKEYFDELYGKGLYVAGWHMNGNLEPFDNFYESAIENSFELYVGVLVEDKNGELSEPDNLEYKRIKFGGKLHF